MVDETSSPATTFVLRAAAFSAITATTISALIVLVVYARPSGLADTLIGFGIIWLFTVIPAGFVGLFVGVLGGSWFNIRRGRIRSMTLLFTEAAVVGVVLSLLGPPLRSVLNHWNEQSSTPTNDFLFGWKAWVFCLSVGCPTAIFFAYAFRKAILTASRNSQSS